MTRHYKCGVDKDEVEISLGSEIEGGFILSRSVELAAVAHSGLLLSSTCGPLYHVPGWVVFSRSTPLSTKKGFLTTN